MNQSAHDKYRESIIRNIAESGWHCTAVGGGENGDPPFAYTVGLTHTYNQPEFIIFGLPPSVAHGILGILAQAAKNGTMPPLDELCDQLVEDYSCALIPVPREQYKGRVSATLWYYAEKPFSLIQVVWPDAKGLFPWDENFDPTLKPYQPVLAHLGDRH